MNHRSVKVDLPSRIRASGSPVALPDFFIAGAPKAGTSALHRALSRHPALFLSSVKEPKFFLSPGVRPRGQTGPGDAHSAREWIWRQSRYEALFEGAPAGVQRGESTAFYLYDRAAPARIARAVPEARIIAVLRDPVDRAYSNWMHLWSDGLEPIADFEAACAAEDERIAAGFAPFWHYRRLGRYGEQIERLLGVFPKEQVCVIHYRELVQRPHNTLDAICRFLGVETGLDLAVPHENTRRLTRPGRRTAVLAKAMRAGAAVGACAPPQVWRAASRPLVWALHRDGIPRPELSVVTRRRLLAFYADDIVRLERVTGDSYSDWLADHGRGAFPARVVSPTP
ncbi:MAG: hypothetical protein QOE80_982 [Actinomycetota bacterium]|jgi:hypothetical protein|nr:hypothetical protein [Actinomycetota bacterium]